LALLILLSIESRAQSNTAVEPVNSLGSAETASLLQSNTASQVRSETASQVQSNAVTNVAMAQSAAAAMATMTGLPTAAPAAAIKDASTAVPAAAITDAPMVASAADITDSPMVAPDAATPAASQFGTADSVAAGPTVKPPTAAPSPAAALLTTECKVLGGMTRDTMQAFLFACCVVVLMLKFRRESGDRTPSEFLMDSSKQLIGAGWIHVLNLSFAKGLAAHFEAGDECNWYWLNIMLDCTLGVAVEYILMLLLTSCIQKMQPSHADDFDTGHYKGQDGSCHAGKYFKQLFLWLVIVTLMKLSMCTIMALGHTSLTSLAQASLAPVSNNATLKLFVVMIVTPVCMNIFQFWMVDNFIKRQGKGMDSSSNDLEMDGSMRTRIQHGDL